MRNGLIAVALIWLANGQPLLAQLAHQNQATVAYLHSLERPDGGYAPQAGMPRSSLGATTSAIRALKYFGDRPRHTEATVKFVASCYDEATGGFRDAPGAKPNVSSTAVGIMAAVDLHMALDRYRAGVVKYLGDHAKNLEEIRIAAASFESLQIKAPKADEWRRQIAQERNADGTFGRGAGAARATGGTTAMILRLGGTPEDRAAVLRVMRAGQRPDGGFGSADQSGSDLSSTYRIMRAFMMLHERPPDPEKLRAFIAKCRYADGGYGVEPGQPSTASGTYYAGIVLHWLDAR
jgi:prenyltransferase beta subunit